MILHFRMSCIGMINVQDNERSPLVDLLKNIKVKGITANIIQQYLMGSWERMWPLNSMVNVRYGLII